MPQNFRRVLGKKGPHAGLTWRAPGVAFLRTRVKICRGGSFKEQKSLGGCRLEEASKNGGVQGGRGVGGNVNLPGPHHFSTPPLNDTLRGFFAL